MIRKNGQTLKTKPNPLFNKSDYLWMYGAFAVALVFRIFHITQIPNLVLSENDIFNQFQYLGNGTVPFESKPIVGLFILYLPYHFLNMENNENFLQYLSVIRAISAFIGSLVPALIMAFLILKGVNRFIAFSSVLIFIVDPSQIITSKLYTTNSLFLFFVSLALLLLAIQQKRPSNLIMNFMVMAALASAMTDTLGWLIVIYVAIAPQEMRPKTMQNAFSTGVLMLGLLIGIRANFCNVPVEGYFEKTMAGRCSDVIKTYIKLFKHPSNYESILYWPVQKLKPVPIWRYDHEDTVTRVVATNNIVGVVAISFAAFLSILYPESILFWLSIVGVWLIKRVEITEYQLPLLLGSISLALAIQSLPYVMRMMMMIVIVAIVVMNFFIFFPWTFGLTISASYNYDIDIWNH